MHLLIHNGIHLQSMCEQRTTTICAVPHEAYVAVDRSTLFWVSHYSEANCKVRYWIVAVSLRILLAEFLEHWLVPNVGDHPSSDGRI